MEPKTSPHAAEAEQIVLASIIIDNDTIHSAMMYLTPDDFFVDTHRCIYSAILEVHRRGVDINPVTIADELKRLGALDRVGGIRRIAALMDGIPLIRDISSYVRVIVEKSTLRKIISIARGTISDCFDHSDSSEIISKLQSRIVGLGVNKDGAVPISEVVSPVLKRIENPPERIKYASGLDIDDIVNIEPGDQVIIGARPSVGKSAFALGWALRLAQERGVLFLSLEMSREQIVQRALAMLGKVNLHSLRRGKVTKAEWERIVHAGNQLRELNLIIVDRLAFDIHQIKAQIAKYRGRVDIAFVDYLQLVKGDNPKDRVREVGQVSLELKRIAMQLNMPIIALAQLSRACETRTDHRPRLSDIRETGDIEQNADIVLLLYRPDIYATVQEERTGTVEVIIAKQRNGPTGTVNLAFAEEYAMFANLLRVSLIIFPLELLSIIC